MSSRDLGLDEGKIDVAFRNRDKPKVLERQVQGVRGRIGQEPRQDLHSRRVLRSVNLIIMIHRNRQSLIEIFTFFAPVEAVKATSFLQKLTHIIQPPNLPNPSKIRAISAVSMSIDLSSQVQLIVLDKFKTYMSYEINKKVSQSLQKICDQIINFRLNLLKLSGSFQYLLAEVARLNLTPQIQALFVILMKQHPSALALFTQSLQLNLLLHHMGEKQCLIRFEQLREGGLLEMKMIKFMQQLGDKSSMKIIQEVGESACKQVIKRLKLGIRFNLHIRSVVTQAKLLKSYNNLQFRTGQAFVRLIKSLNSSDFIANLRELYQISLQLQSDHAFISTFNHLMGQQLQRTIRKEEIIVDFYRAQELLKNLVEKSCEGDSKLRINFRMVCDNYLASNIQLATLCLLKQMKSLIQNFNNSKIAVRRIIRLGARLGSPQYFLECLRVMIGQWLIYSREQLQVFQAIAGFSKGIFGQLSLNPIESLLQPDNYFQFNFDKCTLWAYNSNVWPKFGFHINIPPIFSTFLEQIRNQATKRNHHYELIPSHCRVQMMMKNSRGRYIVVQVPMLESCILVCLNESRPESLRENLQVSEKRLEAAMQNLKQNQLLIQNRINWDLHQDVCIQSDLQFQFKQCRLFQSSNKSLKLQAALVGLLKRRKRLQLSEMRGVLQQCLDQEVSEVDLKNVLETLVQRQFLKVENQVYSYCA